eukprot:g4360.t1
MFAERKQVYHDDMFAPSFSLLFSDDPGPTFSLIFHVLVSPLVYFYLPNRGLCLLHLEWSSHSLPVVVSCVNSSCQCDTFLKEIRPLKMGSPQKVVRAKSRKGNAQSPGIIGGMKQNLSRDEQDKVQLKAFVRWCNVQLSQLPDAMSLEELAGLGDGMTIVRLVEVLTGKPLRTYTNNPRLEVQKTENIESSLKHIQRFGVKLVNIGARDILTGNVTSLLGFVWTLILKYQIAASSSIVDDEESDSNGKSVSGKDKLLEKINARLEPYQLKVTSFKTGWSDGRVISALADAIQPGSIDMAQLEDPVTDTCRAMDLADTFGVPRIMDPEDLVHQPDELSIMTYASYFLMDKKQPKPQDKRKVAFELCRAEGPGLISATQSGCNEFTVFTLGPDGKETKFGEAQVKVGIRLHGSGSEEGHLNLVTEVAEDPGRPGTHRVVYYGRSTPTSKESPAKRLHSKENGHERAGLAAEGDVEEQQGDKLEEGSVRATEELDSLTPGLYLVDVLVGPDSRPLLQSPYRMQVKDSRAVAPELCRAAGDGLARASKAGPNHFSVFVLGPDGQPAAPGAGKVRVEVTPEGAEQAEGKLPTVTVAEDPLWPGTYTVKYTIHTDKRPASHAAKPSPRLVYKVAVLVGDEQEHIAQSPFRVELLPDKVQHACAERCLLAGPGVNGRQPLLPGQSVDFTIQAMDKDGASLSRGGDAFTATLCATDLFGLTEEKIALTDHGDGTYTGRYVVPARGGLFQVHVSLGDEPLGPSPALLRASRVSPAHTVLEGPGLSTATVGHRTSFSISSRDREGNRVTSGNERFHIDILPPELSQQGAEHAARVYNMPIEVTDNMDGTYVVSYTPQSPGQHQVAVSLLGWPVTQSPIHVREDSRKVAAEFCRAEGPGLISASDQSVNEFLVFTMGPDGRETAPGQGQVAVRVRRTTSTSHDKADDDGDEGVEVPASVEEVPDLPGAYRVSYEAPKIEDMKRERKASWISDSGSEDAHSLGGSHGVYVVEVCVGEQAEALANSPWRVEVLPPLDCSTCAKLRTQLQTMEEQASETQSVLAAAQASAQELEQSRDKAQQELAELEARNEQQRQKLEEEKAGVLRNLEMLEAAKLAAEGQRDESRGALAKAREAADKEKEALAKEREAMQKEKAGVLRNLEMLEAAKLAAEGQRDESRGALAKAREAADKEKEALAKEREAMQKEKAGVLRNLEMLEAAKLAAEGQRDDSRGALEKAREAAEKEKEALAKEREAMQKEREAMQSAQATAEAEREALRKEKEKMDKEKAEVARLQKELAASQAQLAKQLAQGEANEASAEMERAQLESDRQELTKALKQIKTDKEQLQKEKEAAAEAQRQAEALKADLEAKLKEANDQKGRDTTELEMAEARLGAVRKAMQDNTESYQLQIKELKEIASASQAELEKLQGTLTGWTRAKLMNAAKEELHDAMPWIGILMLEPEFEPPNQRGVEVRQLIPGGPAETAGLKPHDRIEMGNGETTPNNPKFKKMLRRVNAGDEIVFQVQRGRNVLPLRIKVGTKSLDHKSVNCIVGTKSLDHKSISTLRRMAAGVITSSDTQFIMSLREKSGKSVDAKDVGRSSSSASRPTSSSSTAGTPNSSTSSRAYFTTPESNAGRTAETTARKDTNSNRRARSVSPTNTRRRSVSPTGRRKASASPFKAESQRKRSVSPTRRNLSKNASTSPQK